MAIFELAVQVAVNASNETYITAMTGPTVAGDVERAIMSPESVAAGYVHTAWWKYTPDVSGNLYVSFKGSVTDEPMTTGSFMYSGGPSMETLVRMGTPLPSEIYNYTVTGGVDYWIQGAAIESGATLRGMFKGPLTQEYGPVVLTSPGSQTVMAGQTVQFRSTGGGRPTPTLQWQWHAPIQGA